MENTWAIILAAGKGTRMQAGKVNKVAFAINGEPMIVKVIKVLKNAQISHIVVVVGHSKQSVLSLLSSDIMTVEQRKRLGTAHAVATALKVIPEHVKDVLVVNGDDAFSLKEEVLLDLHKLKREKNASITFVTVEMDNPAGLGRIVRKNGNVAAIVEEKNASEDEKNIKEVNAACYLFSVQFLKENIGKIKKNNSTGEYYLVDLIRYAFERNEQIATLQLKENSWRGVNTKEELAHAEKIFQ